jgi:alpha-1,4-digalacturonate transport system substrate-binding protein
MKQFMTAAAVTLTAATFATGAWAQAKTDVRIMWYSDGVEGQVIRELAGRFNQANPDINIVIDEIAFPALVQTLPVQLASGQGPDIARVVDLPGLAPHFLDLRPLVKDPAYWDANFGAFLPVMRPAGSNAITGYMTQVTVTGPFVNKTLFEQAKVAMPGPKASWDEWMDAARRVARATQTKAAVAWDRSGHRFAGPAISYGAKIFNAKGEPVIDAGYKTAVSKFVSWHKDGFMMREVWAGSGGSTYASSIDEFINGNVVMVLAGSWQIGNLQKKVGNNFDWVAVPNPCGPAACTGIPGGAAWVALKTSKSPKETAAFLEFLASESAYAEFTARTNNIPAHAGLARKGVNYTNADAASKAALGTFSSGVANLSPVAYEFQGYRFNRAIMLPTVTRVTQAIVGEASVDDAVSKIASDMADALKQAQR